MKKILVIFLVLIAVVGLCAGIGYALTGYLNQPRESQRLVDGDMEKSGTTDWTLAGSASLSKQTGSAHSGNRVLRVAYLAGAVGGAYQTVLTVGKKYRITGWTRGDGTAVPRVADGVTDVWIGTSSATWQRVDFTFVSGGTVVNLRSTNLNTGLYIEFDDIFVTEYAGHVQVQDTQKIADGDMELSGTSSWISYAATHSKLTDTPKEGRQYIRITADGTQTYAYAVQIVLTVGKKYRVTGWARSDGTRLPQVFFGGSYLAWTGTNSTSWQRVDAVGTAAGSGTFYLGESGFNSGYTEFDGIMITEYKGEVDITDKQLISDADMEYTAATTTDGGEWSATTGYISKKTTSPHSGTRVLRVKANGVQTYAYAYRAILTIGKTYRVTGFVRSDGTQLPDVYLGSNTGGGYAGTNSTNWQRFDFTERLAGNTAVYFGQNNGTTGHVEYDDVFVTEVK